MSGIDFSALSERGLRPRNDDAFCAERIGKYFVFAVADGLAGHAYGDIASKTAIDALKGAVKNTGGPARDAIMEGVRNAEAEIRALSQQSPEHAGLATKLVACLIDEKMQCTVLDVGDRNCHVIAGSTIEHAGTAAKSRRPPGSTPAPYADPKPPSLADMVAHVLGEPHRMKESDFSRFVLRDEYLLLSSDGMTDVLSEDAIAGIVRKTDGNLEVACEKLVQEAMQAGSESTITVVLAHVKG